MAPRKTVAAKITATSIVMLLSAGIAFAQQSNSDRLRRGEEVMRTLNAGQAQQTLEALRQDFPFLADAITGYALGDVWSRPGLDHRTRQIAAVAAFAALGHRVFMKIHAGYALNLGVTPEELKEVVYLTTVHAGFPRAIEAAQTLAELFKEREQQTKKPN
jgi:4-carboxymuconolactone decarboxylase